MPLSLGTQCFSRSWTGCMVLGVEDHTTFILSWREHKVSARFMMAEFELDHLAEVVRQCSPLGSCSFFSQRPCLPEWQPHVSGPQLPEPSHSDPALVVASFSLLTASFTCKDPCNYIGPAWHNSRYLPVLRSGEERLPSPPRPQLPFAL